jgi:hypothetical protein
MLFFRGTNKWYLYRAIDEHGQVVDVLLRKHRDTTTTAAENSRTSGASGRRLAWERHQQPNRKPVGEDAWPQTDTDQSPPNFPTTLRTVRSRPCAMLRGFPFVQHKR